MINIIEYFKELKMNFKEIAKAHELKSVRVKGNSLIINQGEATYIYSHAKIAKAVALKLKNLIGL